MADRKDGLFILQRISMKKLVKVDKTLVDTIIGVHCIFQDIEKVTLWMNTKNFNLGNCKPVDLFAAGKGKKVLEFVDMKCNEINK